MSLSSSISSSIKILVDIFCDSYAFIMRPLKGKKLYIIGIEQSGKTTFFNFIVDGTYKREYIESLKEKKGKIDTSDFPEEIKNKLPFQIAVDTIGLESVGRKKRDCVLEALNDKKSVIVFLINVTKFTPNYKKPEVENSIKSELQAIGEDAKEKNRKILIICTHLDMINGFKEENIGCQDFLDANIDVYTKNNLLLSKLPLEFIGVSFTEKNMKKSVKSIFTLLKKMSEDK